MRDGWPEDVQDEWKAFHRRRVELTLEATKVVIHEKFRNQLLGRLHEAHLGIVRMKILVRMHCWWPHLDQDIEHKVKELCGMLANTADWCDQQLGLAEVTHLPWQRLLIDFVRFGGDCFLILVDEHSK